ncbi:glycerol-3-phosphate cytidylyltransferase [Peribacillus cavernae]|uniref:Glycerol-3-phosphate cytidylyltransferase n=1 Tax=Peribacillus cavernae TaxID=1674310 RepID=A0A3S0U3F8_9BACI|nr:adenylyltransferase/cytidyltransferase family protein [Peribacillus cavernae]MDQ0217482.1 glycerol-3-phosphate cytidylyltransferase [Peribacillus cavernae]RUQ30076.1 glycerol-3-phosphate cytidylyltransferase [Peribacillus cavernae]
MKQYKVGYTTGVFDLFHVGHLNILKKAKEQCEFLIVGVSTDDLVMAYKNKPPIISHMDRTAIVKGIKYVDQVIPQTNRNKILAWERLNFDVMFVGDDWKGNALFMEVEIKFNKIGVDIVYFPYTQDISSTIVKEKIKL